VVAGPVLADRIGVVDSAARATRPSWITAVSHEISGLVNRRLAGGRVELAKAALDREVRTKHKRDVGDMRAAAVTILQA
jgi:hypothetical protein